VVDDQVAGFIVEPLVAAAFRDLAREDVALFVDLGTETDESLFARGKRPRRILAEDELAILGLNVWAASGDMAVIDATDASKSRLGNMGAPPTCGRILPTIHRLTTNAILQTPSIK
jgi:hypothetical protein